MDPYASALDQAASIRSGEVSSTELTQAYLKRIEALNPKLNAYVLITADLALAQAREADAAGPPDGGRPLRGVPVSIKDLVSLAGYPMTLGSKAFEDHSLPIDFFPVARLKEEGCPILGKTNLSEFGTRPTTEHGLFGATHNPWNLAHSAGGSSGGAAAAVAPSASSRRGAASRLVRCWASTGRASAPMGRSPGRWPTPRPGWMQWPATCKGTLTGRSRTGDSRTLHVPTIASFGSGSPSARPPRWTLRSPPASARSPTSGRDSVTTWAKVVLTPSHFAFRSSSSSSPVWDPCRSQMILCSTLSTPSPWRLPSRS